MRTAFEHALASAPKELREDAARFFAAREAAVAEWRLMGDGAHVSTLGSMALHPTRALTVLRYWASYASLAADWAARFAPQAGTVIVGHSHRAFHTAIGGRHVVNTGAFGFPGRPFGVVLEGTTVRMHALIKRGHLFALASDAKAAWPVSFHAEGIGKLEPAPSVQSDAAASTPAMKRAASPSAARSSDTR